MISEAVNRPELQLRHPRRMGVAGGYCDDIKASLGFSNFGVSIGGVNIDTLLIDSNGLLMFNPSDEDISKHTALSMPFPDPGVPNSVIAPLWTDLLQGESGIGDIHTGIVVDGSDTWFVVEWYKAREWSTEILPDRSTIYLCGLDQSG